MKNIDIIFIGLIALILGFYIGNQSNKIQSKIEQSTVKQFEYLTDFELIELAIIWQETKANPNPKYSDGKSEGILQITPIYVKEANRILGKSEYTLHDRRNPLKSHEMFLVVQSYHNPKKDVKKAVILHNKGKRYFDEVMGRYNCLKLHQEILIFKNNYYGKNNL